MSPDKVSALAEGWPRAQEFRRSIRMEFALSAAALFLILMGAAGYFSTVRTVASATRAVAEALVIQARAFSGPAGKHIIASDEPDALLLNDICRKLIEDNPDVFWAGIAGTDQVLLAHTDLVQVMAGNRLERGLQGERLDFLRPQETFKVQNDTVYISTPIRQNGVELGRLGLAASTRQIEAAQTSAVVTAFTVTLVIMLLGVPAALIILTRKLKPVTQITESLQRVDVTSLSLDIPVQSRNEFGYLAATLRTMGEKLKDAQGLVLERERIARELDIARDIQMSMLPRSFPSGACFQIAGSYTSAMEVGGDYYDFIPLDKGRLGILVADVSGKSLPGMLVMLMTRDIVKSVAQSESDPGMLLARVNRELIGNIHREMFVTMFFGSLELTSGKLRFASAGHNALVWYRDGYRTCELIRPPGYPLGMMPGPVFEKRIKTAELQLREGDWLVQYTDGVNEAQNAGKEEFGMERLTRTIQDCRHEEAPELVRRFMARHAAFVGDADPYDDITLLALKWSTRVAETMNRGKEPHTGAAKD